MYQQIRLSDISLVGAPGPLPYAVAGWTDDLLRDLSQLDPSFGLAGMAFWTVVVTTPAFDPTKQMAVPPASYTADPKTQTVTGTATVRDMTAAEFLAANPVPEVISDKQCFQQLAVLGKVTEADALAAVKTGAMPDVVTNGIAALPADEQFAAEMAICGATQFFRSNPLTPVFLGFLGMSSADGDALWRAAALL